MKRLSKLDVIRLSHYANIAFRKRVRRAKLKRERQSRSGYHERQARGYISAPRVFSITKNYDETVTCLLNLKNYIKENYSSKKRNRPSVFIDLARIEDLQPAAALVLAAELDRWRRVSGMRLKPRNLKEWNPSVRNFLYDLGLFDLLAVDKVHSESARRMAGGGRKSIVALPFVTDCKNDKQTTDNLAERLAEVLPVFKESLDKKEGFALLTALAEACLNSVQHAYTVEELVYPVTDYRWWAAACYQEEGRVVKFMVYDQGVGIKKTLPKTSMGRTILRRFGIGDVENAVPAGLSAGECIKFLLENPISSTGHQHRGKGFPQIIEATASWKGRLRVLSGTGSAIYDNDGRVVAQPDSRYHLGGTLLEWTFRLDET